MDIYKSILRPILFSGLKAEPEFLHHQVMQILRWLAEDRKSFPPSLIRDYFQQTCCLSDERLKQTLWGLSFPNPIGLAAGYDKDGEALSVWSNFGFGFAEVGTVTLEAQPGNPHPRLFRLPRDLAVLNRMGFNNQGAAAMAKRFSLFAREKIAQKIPIGINLGKSKVTPLEKAAADYLGSFRLLKEWGDYFVVNVSSPNTPGLRSLQESSQLATIFDAIQQENQGQKPLLVKIAPDLDWEAIAQIIELTKTYQLSGIIATNTTISRDGLKTKIIDKTGKSVKEEAGGISGAPLRQRSTEIIRFIWQQTQGTLTIIGSGGIFTAENAWEKIIAGASLLQVYTGLIYEGPWMIRRLNEGLLQKLSERGLSNISQAIGLEK